MRATEHCYIVTDEQILNGEPIIKGTRTPVRAIVETWRLGVLPEEIPSHLETVAGRPGCFRQPVPHVRCGGFGDALPLGLLATCPAPSGR